MGRGSGKDHQPIDPRRRGQAASDGAPGAGDGVGDGEANADQLAAADAMRPGAGGADLEAGSVDMHAGAAGSESSSDPSAVSGREPVVDISKPDIALEKKRGIEYGWMIGVPDEDGWQDMAILSVSHRRAGAGSYYQETNSPAAYVASLVSARVKEDPAFPGSIMTEMAAVDPRREILMKVAGDRYSKKKVAAVAADALELVTGTENAFHSLDEYREDAKREPIIQADPGPSLGGSGAASGGANAAGSGSGPAGAPGGAASQPPRDPKDTSFSQPDRRFKGPAYNYLRKADRLPTYDEIAGEDDPICRVKLFSPSGRFTYYVAAATNYQDHPSPIVTGYALSPFGPDADEWGDSDMAEIASAKTPPFNLPIERDTGFKPMRLSEIKTALAEGKHV